METRSRQEGGCLEDAKYNACDTTDDNRPWALIFFLLYLSFNFFFKCDAIYVRIVIALSSYALDHYPYNTGNAQVNDYVRR